MYYELQLCLVLFLQDFINNISVAHRLKSTKQSNHCCASQFWSVSAMSSAT